MIIWYSIIINKQLIKIRRR